MDAHTKGNPDDWEIVRKWLAWIETTDSLSSRPCSIKEFYAALHRLIADCAPPPPPSDEQVTLYCRAAGWPEDREGCRSAAVFALTEAERRGVRISLSPVGDEK